MTDGERLAVGFSRVLRQGGMKVPASATINYTQALGAIGLDDAERVYWTGRATLVNRPEDIALYDQAFRSYWQRRGLEGLRVESVAQDVTMLLDSDDPATDEPDTGEESDESGEIEAVRFSRVEILAEKDFGDCTDAELAELSTLMTRLRFTSHRRQSRRQIATKSTTSRHDLERTVRLALRHHGEPMRWAHTANAWRPRRLVMILDVSGSMESYARALLRFAHAAVVARNRVEVFTLGTRLTRVTRQLGNRDPDAALRAVTPDVVDWSGGTRLGEVLGDFNDRWGIRGMARGSVVVILSDGWDRGEAELLGEQMERLHRVTHRLIWVNPLKATPGYAPLAAGMAAALPHVDTFVAGNSYRSLEDLAAIIAGATDPEQR
ncbi:MAG: VWA domain-containing protein [Acidimicrobiales bacterium]